MAKWLRPPVYVENLWTDNHLFRYYHQDRGYTLIVRGTTVEQVTYPYNGDIQPGDYTYLYMGGHISGPLTPEEVDILTNAGYGAYISEEPP